MDEYLACLEKELNLYEINFKKAPLDNLYIGGGTPTILSEKQLKKLFKIIHKFFTFKKDIQISTEGTPETSTLKKLKLLKSLGVNRFTIGVQTFDEKVLKKANRNHSIKDIYQSITNIRKAGIDYTNLDILFGLVGEKWNSYIFTLKNIVDLRPDCVSFMTFDCGQGVDSDYGKKSEKSYFFKHSLKDKIFSFLSYTLEKVGYQKAEGFSDSTFILKGKEMSVNRNLLNRFHLNPVFGLGSTAYSSLGLLQYSMPLHNNEYFLFIKKGKLPRFVGIELDKEEHIRRYFILSYILWGKINKKEFQKKFKKKIERVIDEKFKKLKDDQRLFDTDKEIIFLPSSEVIKGISKYSLKKYGNQERSFLFCLKYFYSPKIIKQYKRRLNIY